MSWPDDTSIIDHRLDATQALDVPNVAAMHLASPAMYLVRQKGAAA